jgi:endonuclease/exonuclease/phosphatase (EEP) superfamily protein YafD
LVLGRVLLTLVWAVMLVLALVVVARIVAYDRATILAALNAQTLWLFLPAYLIASAAWCFRRYGLAVVATLVVVFHLGSVVPSVGSAEEVTGAARSAPRLRVLSANVLHSNPTKARLTRELLAADADVVLLQETTSGWLDVLDELGFEEAYPYREFRPREDSRGQAVFSRLPLGDVRVEPPAISPTISARVTVGGRQVSLVNVHVRGLSEGVARHESSVDRLEALTGSLPRPRVLAGDFNASPYNRTMQRVDGFGLDSAHERRGRGLAVTWPNGRHPVPPIRLDHVFVDDELVVLDIRELAGPGSDHKPVLVDLALL